MRSAPREVPPLVHEGVRYEAPHWGVSGAPSCEQAPSPLLEPDPAQALELAGYSAAEASALLERQRLRGVLAAAVQELTRAASRQRLQSMLGAALNNPGEALTACQDLLASRLAGGPPVPLEALREQLGLDLSAASVEAVLRDWEANRYASPQDEAHDPDRLRVELAQRGSARPEIECAVRKLRLSGATQRAMQTILQEQMAGMLAGLTLNDPFTYDAGVSESLEQFQPSRVRELLTAEGELEPAEVEEALAAYEAEMRELEASLAEVRSAPREQPGGVVVAYDAASGEILWSSRAYTTEYDSDLEQCVQDVFITGFEVDGPHLVVRDERRRLHRLDRRTGRVVDSRPDLRPTAEDLARQALRELPASQRQQLWDELWGLKGLMDQHNFSAYGLATSPAQELAAALDRFLASLGQVSDRHPLLEGAWRAGVKHAAALRQGADAHVLYGWLQEELQLVFLELFQH